MIGSVDRNRNARRIGLRGWLLAGLFASLASVSFGATSAPESRSVLDGSRAGAARGLEEADALFADRARGESEGRALPGPIDAAIDAYAAALASDPEQIEVRWKLLRALHYSGDFVLREKRDRQRIFERARAVGDEGLRRLEERLAIGVPLHAIEPARMRATLDQVKSDQVKSDQTKIDGTKIDATQVARLYFWTAICVGAWSRDAGLLSAVRAGVANRLHDYSQVTLALEPDYEDGGAYRLLGSLHAELPRVPFLSSWVDRDEAIPMLRAAISMAPAHPGNRLLLALTLRDLAPERRDEADRLLSEVAELSPRPVVRVEDLALRDQARRFLEADGGTRP